MDHADSGCTTVTTSEVLPASVVAIVIVLVIMVLGQAVVMLAIMLALRRRQQQLATSKEVKLRTTHGKSSGKTESQIYDTFYEDVSPLHVKSQQSRVSKEYANVEFYDDVASPGEYSKGYPHESHMYEPVK